MQLNNETENVRFYKHNSKAKQNDVNKTEDIPGCKTDLDWNGCSGGGSQ